MSLHESSVKMIVFVTLRKSKLYQIN